MGNDSQYFSNCSNLTTQQLASINLAFSGTGAGCFLVSSLLTLLLLISKSYHSVLQRLFLYLMVATTVRELFLAASIEHQFDYPEQKNVCTWIAFIYNWTGIVVFVFTVGIMIYLFFLVRYLAKGNIVGPQFLQSSCRRVSLESSYVVLSALLTFAYASIPYFTKKYGLAGAWCWIKALDEDCKLAVSGLLSQLLYGYIFYESGGIIGIVLMIAIAVVYCRLPVTLHEARLLLKKTFVVMIGFLLYIIIAVFALSIRMHTAEKGQYRHYAIWIIFGITYPISLLLFPIAFLLSFYPIGKFCKHLKNARDWKCCCFQCNYTAKQKPKKCDVHFQQQPVYSTQAPTYPESSRVSPPSSTYFKVPYTDKFTHITTENAPLVPEECTDTGYGTISQQ